VTGVGPVGVVGASARAAVTSLARAGFSAWAVDLFADRDLRRLAPCARCPFDRYPAALPGLCDAFPPGPVLYTGGLENHPDVVRDLSRRRPLWGNAPDTLVRVRDPFALADVLVSSGITGIPITSLPRVAPPAPRAVWKAFRSAGGLGVRFADPGEPAPPGAYLQEFVDGPPMSAVYVTAAGGTVLLGVTRQLVGESWLHARPFAYCGNVGPVPVSSDLEDALRRMGEAVGRAGGLSGVWGVDFVPRGGLPYPVEVNPRYTAGVEVLELGGRFAALAAHAAAFTTTEPPPAGAGRPGSPVGKAVYYAPGRIVFPPAGPWDAEFERDSDPWRVPAFADIPDPGAVVEPGWPVLTFFATGSTADACRAKLEERAAELDGVFGRAA
jgi:predicted ATP-grasp superfamily ATP-dependent carboligase